MQKIRAYLDANVILRHLTEDPPDLADRSASIFRAADEGQMSLIIAQVALAEVVWVLQSFYGLAKSKISKQLQAFLSNPNLEVPSRDHLLSALALYADKNIDFADALLSAIALAEGPAVVCSFDSDFEKVAGIERLSGAPDDP